MLPFAAAAHDLLQRFPGVRLSASTVWRDTAAAGERVRAQQKDGRMVEPTPREPGWTAARQGLKPAAYGGLDAFRLEPWAEQGRSQARALGIAQGSDWIAVTDGGHGLAEALHRHLAANLPTILDWYHAAEHLCDVAAVLHAQAAAARPGWAEAAKGSLSAQGGEALLTSLQALPLPPRVGAEVREALRKRLGYFTNNRPRTDYPT